jgi:hypothetical protein
VRRPGYKAVGFFASKKKVRPITVRTGPKRVKLPKARTLPKVVVKVETKPQPKIETTITEPLGQKQAHEIIKETQQALINFEKALPKSEMQGPKAVDKTKLAKVKSEKIQTEPGLISPHTFDHMIRAQGSESLETSEEKAQREMRERLERNPGPYDNPIQKANSLAEKRAEVEREAAALGVNPDKLIMDQVQSKLSGKDAEIKPGDIPSLDAVAAYKEKQEEKIARLEARAARTAAEAKETHDRAYRMADVIPFGQPILVGHYSENRDRNYRDKIHRTYDKSFELSNKAKKLQKRAADAADPYAINSDDPEAILKLKQKLEGLIVRREKIKSQTLEEFKRANPQHYYDDHGFDAEHVRRIFLEGDTRNINSLRKRIDELRATRAVPSQEKVINGVRMHVDQSDNRVKLFFPGIPDFKVRSRLKQNGFHWSPYNKAWMRKINNAAIVSAESVLNSITPHQNGQYSTGSSQQKKSSGPQDEDRAGGWSGNGDVAY